LYGSRPRCLVACGVQWSRNNLDAAPVFDARLDHWHARSSAVNGPVGFQAAESQMLERGAAATVGGREAGGALRTFPIASWRGATRGAPAPGREAARASSTRRWGT